jgi:hypothetical protein
MNRGRQVKTGVRRRATEVSNENGSRSESLAAQGLSVFPSGWLWDLAQQWADKYPYSKYPNWPPTKLSGVKPEPVDLSVFETSYCRGGGKCGPGYSALHSPDIRTDLCIHIKQLASATCGIPYEAPIWVVSQEKVDGYLGHPDALDTSLP